MAEQSERFELKLSKVEKKLLRRAAKILKISMAKLLLSAGLARAAEALQGKE